MFLDYNSNWWLLKRFVLDYGLVIDTMMVLHIIELCTFAKAKQTSIPAVEVAEAVFSRVCTTPSLQSLPAFKGDIRDQDVDLLNYD